MIGTPSDDDDPRLSERLRRQAGSFDLPRPDEIELGRRSAKRRRTRAGAFGAALLALGVAGGATFVTLAEDDGTNRVQVASPDGADKAADETIEGDDRARGGSELEFGSLPLSTREIGLPDDIAPWNIWSDGDVAYAMTLDGWISRTSDLSAWERLPEPPVIELIASSDLDAFEFLYQGVSARGDVIAAVVTVFDTSVFLFGGEGEAAGEEDVDFGAWAHCDGVRQASPERHIVVSFDAGQTWAAHAVAGPVDVGNGSPVPDWQATVATDGSTVVVSSVGFSHFDPACALHDAGVLGDDDTLAELGNDGSTVDYKLEDGTEGRLTAADLGMTDNELSTLFNGEMDAPSALSVLEPGGELREVESNNGWLELIATSRGYVTITHAELGTTLRRSLDGGRSWTEVEGPGDGWVQASGESLLAMGVRSARVSHDLGATWDDIDGVGRVQPNMFVVNGDHVLVLGHDEGEMQMADIPEMEVAIGSDGRTLVIQQGPELERATVIDDATGEVLFDLEIDPMSPDTADGINHTDDGGVRISDADGNVLFEASGREMSQAFTAAFESVEAEEERLEGPSPKPETVVGHRGPDGEWIFAPLSDLTGSEGDAFWAIPWEDGFLVVHEPAIDEPAMPEPSDEAEIDEDGGWFAYAGQTSSLLYLTPAG